MRVVVIAAAGKAFCAGHDLREIRASPSHDYDQALFKQAAKLMISIQQLPVIAGVHGIATAASCQLVTMCDLAAATGSASDSTRLRDWLWRTPNQFHCTFLLALECSARFIGAIVIVIWRNLDHKEMG